jgi:hypothetical protein
MLATLPPPVQEPCLRSPGVKYVFAYGS